MSLLLHEYMLMAIKRDHIVFTCMRSHVSTKILQGPESLRAQGAVDFALQVIRFWLQVLAQTDLDLGQVRFGFFYTGDKLKNSKLSNE